MRNATLLRLGSAHRPTDIMHTISWDLFGRTGIAGVGNTRYFNVGRERACGWAWTKPLTYKSQAAAHCISVIRFEQNQTGAHVKVFSVMAVASTWVPV